MPRTPTGLIRTGDGLKWCNASFYVEDNTLAGEEVVFSGHTIENSLVSPFQSRPFIKVFDAGYVLLDYVHGDLVTGNDFSISLTVANDPTYHTQYGFETDSIDSVLLRWPRVGQVKVIPEPSTLIFGLMLAGAMVWCCVNRGRPEPPECNPTANGKAAPLAPPCRPPHFVPPASGCRLIMLPCVTISEPLSPWLSLSGECTRVLACGVCPPGSSRPTDRPEASAGQTAMRAALRFSIY